MDRQPLPPPPQQQPPLPPQIITTPAPPPQYQGDPVVYQQYPETTAVAVEQHVPQPPSQYRQQLPPPSIHIIQNPVETSSVMQHSNVVPTTPIAAPDVGGFGTGPGPMQLHAKRGSGQVVDTELRFGQKTGGVQMRKVTSMDKIKRHVSNVKNGYTNGGGEDNLYEREPLITNPGVIGADEPEPSDLFGGIGLCGLLLTGVSWIIVIVTLPFSLCVCFKVVQEYERAVIFRLGRLLSGGSRGPGIFFVLPCIESYQKVDLRTITLGVPPQEVLTKDSVTVSVDAVVYYRVSNATISVANVENAHHSTRLLAQTTLRNILGTKNLHEILSDRESISGSMQAALDEATEPWGIKVERVEIKDVRLPVQLQRAMAAEAEAAREARAKVIAAEGEQKASRALREASDVIADTPSALQLRYLQTLNTISAEKNSTIVFPLPIDILSHLMKKSKAE